MKLVVMIPAYNEEATIGQVIENIPRSIENIDSVQVLVIDDGSTDRTFTVARRSGADNIIVHKKNMGLGAAFKTGLENALLMGADVIVNIDADNQYNPQNIPKLIGPIMNKKADMVLGYRDISNIEHMSLDKKLGNKLATWVARRVTGFPIKDAQTGFRALSKEASLRMNLIEDYTYVHETIIQANIKHMKIEQMPVEFRKRIGKSKLIPSILFYAKRAGGIIIRSYRDYHPLKVFSFISLLFFIASSYLAINVLLHYLSTGLFTGRVGAGIASGILFISSIIVFIVGLLADMLKRQHMLEEKILYRLKKNKYVSK